ncbi:hypothetical protein J6590_056221 [Homalodisca vitripennis]|nr:hypothetical protein J6590_056221 [Homalodisca vitripennis]
MVKYNQKTDYYPVSFYVLIRQEFYIQSVFESWIYNNVATESHTSSTKYWHKTASQNLAPKYHRCYRIHLLWPTDDSLMILQREDRTKDVVYR